MEDSRQTDYKLDQGFLLKQISESLSTVSTNKQTVVSLNLKANIEFPVCVQLIQGKEERGYWRSYQLSDGEFAMWRFAFVSKQPLPEKYSLLKITQIRPLDYHIGHYRSGSYLQYLLGEIKFEVEVNGKDIGHVLHQIKPDKYIDMTEIIARRNAVGLQSLMETFLFVDPCIKMMKSMWKNREHKFCDVRFTFSDDKDNVAIAHKSVLVSVSDVFEAHFNQDYRDGDSVQIVDTEFYYFNKLLEFIYTGNVQFMTVNVAFELLYLAKKYFLSSLEDACHNTIKSHCSKNPESILKLFTLNERSYDKQVRDCLTSAMEQETRHVLNSPDFLKCDFATVEWILSMDDLHIDEWSLLCALYKWACHNGVNASCQEQADGEDDKTMDCLHGLLECISFENIDGPSLQRFFSLPKLAEMVNVDELKQNTFDSILEDVRTFGSVRSFGGSSSTFRGFLSKYHFYIEVMVKNYYIAETPLKNLRMSDGSVFGMKVKIVPNNYDDFNDEYTVNVLLSFEFLYTTNDEIDNSLYVEVGVKDFNEQWKGIVSVGEQFRLDLHLPDYRDKLQDKIEDMGTENSSDSVWEKVLGLEIAIGCYERTNMNEDDVEDVSSS